MKPVTAFDDVVAVILAGGFGRRIQHLLPEQPKPMAQVAGRPFVEWIIRWLRLNGISRVVLSTGFRAEKIQEYFQDNVIADCDVTCVSESSPMGTAGGFLNAVSVSGLTPGIWLAVNGDSIVAAQLTSLLQKVQRSEWDGGILGVEVPDAARFGSLRVDRDGLLLEFAEKRPGRGLINAGVYGFAHALLEAFPTKRPLGFESDIFPMLLAKGYTIGVSAVFSPFLDIGTPESLSCADEFIRSHFLTLE
jgi:D-glycero-alpha-D-manno-heptose 1-phosphate guanylyltransferase